MHRLHFIAPSDRPQARDFATVVAAVHPTPLAALRNLQLVAKSDHLKLQTGASSEAGKKAVKDGKKDFAYDPEVTEHRPEKREILRRTECMGDTGSNFGR